jgi:hypothetical protein
MYRHVNAATATAANRSSNSGIANSAKVRSLIQRNRTGPPIRCRSQFPATGGRTRWCRYQTACNPMLSMYEQNVRHPHAHITPHSHPSPRRSRERKGALMPVCVRDRPTVQQLPLHSIHAPVPEQHPTQYGTLTSPGSTSLNDTCPRLPGAAKSLGPRSSPRLDANQESILASGRS